MRKLHMAVVAGVAAVAVAGTAVAASQNRHILNVALPDGSVAHVAYEGDVAPKVMIDDSGFAPVAFDDSSDASPFAMFDRIAAEMDQQMAGMLRQADALRMQAPTAADGKPDLAAFGNLPAGVVSYSYVSTSNGATSCTQSWQVTSQGPNLKPQVVSNSSGDCGSATRGVALAPGSAAASTVKATTVNHTSATRGDEGPTI